MYESLNEHNSIKTTEIIEATNPIDHDVRNIPVQVLANSSPHLNNVNVMSQMKSLKQVFLPFLKRVRTQSYNVASIAPTPKHLVS